MQPSRSTALHGRSYLFFQQKLHLDEGKGFQEAYSTYYNILLKKLQARIEMGKNTLMFIKHKPRLPYEIGILTLSPLVLVS
jgi:hypothetical protein